MLKKVIRSIEELLQLPIIFCPGSVGRLLRYQYYKRRLKSIGRNVVIDLGVQILNPEWVSIGNNTWIDCYVIILAGPPTGQRRIARKPNSAYIGEEGEVRIGSNCHIAPFVILSGHGGLWIGDNVGVASGAKIHSYSHHYRDLSAPDDETLFKYTPMAPPDEQAIISGAVVLEDDTAVCLNAVILPGSVLSRASWLGTNALLCGTIPPASIASGNPAHVVKGRLKDAAEATAK